MSFALSSSITSSLPDYFVLTHHQHLLLHLQRPPRPQHGAGVNPQEHPLAGGSLADFPTRLHTQEWWEILEHKETCCKYTNHHYMQKVYFFFTEEMQKVSNWCDVLSGILQDQCIDVESVVSMKGCFALWEGFREEFRNPPEYEIREYWECFWYYSYLIQEQSEGILNVECLRYSSPSWERSMLANDQAIKWAKARVFVYADSVICLGETEEGSGAAEKWKGKFEDIKGVFTISRCSGNRWRRNWTRVKKIPRFFKIVHSSRDPERLDTEEHPTEGTELSSCQCSTTSCGNQMIGIASQTLRMSTITRSSSFQDTGRFLVQAQRRHGTEVLTNDRESGISHKIRWYNFESRSSQMKTKHKYHSLQ